MAKHKQPRRKKSSASAKALMWTAALGAVALVLYAVVQLSGVPYDEDAIKVVSFANLDDRQKRTALVAANQARCDCGCGMNLAQCVSTDMTCPVRTDNIERIRTMVRDAGKSPG